MPLEKSIPNSLSPLCRELEGLSYDMNALTFLVDTTLDELCMLCGPEPAVMAIQKGTMVGLFNPWNGSGSYLEIELEKEVLIPSKMVFRIQIEGAKNKYGYTVNQTYGLVGSAWKETGGAVVVKKETAA